MFMKRKMFGIELINEVSDRFSDMVDKLNQGVVDCRNEQIENNVAIKQLQDRNDTLGSSVSRAASIATGLRTLLGE